VAYFFTSMLLARADAQEKDFPIPLYIDPPLKATSSTDRKHTLSYYVRPVLNEAHRIKPVHIGFFKGKLDFNTLGFLNMMTMRLITTLVKEVKEGDFRDWDAMRSWAKQVYPMLAA
jgi:menaquinone-dependent protoporphyrinogen IX oxidase